MEYVRIAILSTYDKVCAFLDNKAKKALHYYDDELVEYLKGTASTLTLTATARHPDSQYLVEGNKLAFKYRDRDYYMNIMHVERDEYEVIIEAYSLSFELLNEQRGSYSAAEAMSFTEYMSVFDPEHTVTLGINEVTDKSITHSWEGEDTILARIFSLATVFSAEVEFLPELNDNYSLKRIVMNVYKEHSDTAQGVGQRRSDLTLRYGKDISGITKISDITELYTAITPVGRDGLTVASLDKTEYDADGNVEYRSPLNSTHIYAVQARDRFPSNLMANENERYIGVNWEYDTENVNTLYGQALAQLKKNCVPKISYEVNGYFDTNIGDTVTIADESFNPVLYLEARVTEQHRSFTDPTQNKTTFDNFKELQSEIDSSLLARVEELIAQGKTYTAMISTNNGIVFKNGVGETTMTAHVRDSVGEELAENFVIHWYKDGSEVYIGNPYTISADDVDGKAVYRFEALDATGVVKAFYEITVSDVNDGEDGQPGEPGEDGRSYVIESSVPEIKVSGDGFTPDRVTFNMYFYDGSGNRQDLDVYAVADQFIDGEWVQSWTWTTKSNIKTIFTSVIDQAAKFVRLTVYNTRSDGIFSDKLAEYTLPITFNTFSAPGTYTSDTAPTQPFTGMLWKNTGTAGGYIQNAIYQWNGSEWTLYYFAAANLDVKKLSAISGDMGELTAGSIEIPWEYTDNPQFTIQGTTKFSKSEGGTNPISVEFKLINKGTQEVDATGSAVYDYNGVTISINYTTGGSRRMRLGYGSLSFSDNENTATFGLSEILKLKSGAEEWTALPLNTNYVASEGNTPMYRKVPIYGSTSWKVELKGQVARSDGENVHGTVGTLPEGYRPSDSVIYMQADDTFMGARVAVVNTGAVQSRTVYNSKYVSLDGISFEVEG